MKTSRTVINLNGEWKIQPGTKNEHPREWNHSVAVPALIDVSAPLFDWRDYKYFWYRATFVIQELCDNVWLTIEQAMFGTEVWLNGTLLGSDIACYTSQEYSCNSHLRYGVENELLIRVGARTTLPPKSAVGKDQERETFIPGIWGDVYLTCCGNPYVSLVQVIPHINDSKAEVNVWIENTSEHEIVVEVHSTIVEKVSCKVVSPEIVQNCIILPHTKNIIKIEIPIHEVTLWFPDSPFLYTLQTCIVTQGEEVDRKETIFGMREFNVVGADFFLNDKKIYLRGSNIAFHRFLSDEDRGMLPWNTEWVKKLLIDIPKDHNFNFFRFHIGQAYNRWYDIADENGMLLQNEWQFWTTTGSKEQISKEFTRWVQDNWNHPSIIIWDALNESSDKIVQEEIVPEMKLIDPTRPWESVDFVEQHPYIYSLGPVLVDKKFGFTEALHQIELSSQPSVVNEFLWWWFDKENKPTVLMDGVVERWLGIKWTTEELVAHQQFLAQELIELFRRMRVDAIQPFVYLSNNAGPTANWFAGNIALLQPKPILATLKNLFSPFGISIELWDRHFIANEKRIILIHVFNDEPISHKGRVRYGITDEQGDWIFENFIEVTVGEGNVQIISAEIKFPLIDGTYSVRAELCSEGDDLVIATSKKPAHVFQSLTINNHLQCLTIGVFDERNEMAEFLIQQGLTPVSDFQQGIDSIRTIIVCEWYLRSADYQYRLVQWTNFVNSGGTIIIIEPEFGIKEKETIRITNDIEFVIERRIDADKGGYDSYVFAEDGNHPLWKGICKDHLKMFNGGFGGEIVSQHTITSDKECTVLARCGLSLGVNAVFEIHSGKGKVIVSRLQLRDRLVARKTTVDTYCRRIDPVLQQYVMNLIEYSTGK